jgi:lysophospholipase L1-like esterase
MVLTVNELIGYTLNSINYKVDEDGYISFLRFTEKQLKLYADSPMFKTMSLCSAGVCLSFDTTGDEITFECRAESILKPKNLQSETVEKPIDILPKVNTLKLLGEYAKYMIEAGVRPDIKQYFDLYTDGNYVKSVKVKSGKIVFKFSNDDHRWVNVKIWFPLFTPVSIRTVSISGQHRECLNKASSFIYSFGDSITQGFLVGKPSFGYVEALSLLLNANILNQGISGYYYNPEILNDFENLPAPGLITVAYGTNDWFLNFSFKEIENKVKGFYDRLDELYPAVPVYVITPIWRKDMAKQMESGTLSDVINLIKEIVFPHKNMHIIDGMSISPHCPKLYDDGFLHPSISGNAYMAPRIYKDIIKHRTLGYS